VKAKSLLEAAGLAVLYVLPIANAFFKSWHVNSYHHAQPVASVPRAIFLLILLVWVLAWLTIAALERMSPRVRTIAWIALSTLLVWFLGRIAFAALGAHPAVARHALFAAHIGVIVVPIALLALWRLQPHMLRQALDAVRFLVAVAGFGMLILLPKLGWQGLRFQGHEETAFTSPSLPATAHPTQPRIVWIVMDELSYDQVFGRRPSGLAFPNFERLSEHSATFSNLQPTGYHTENVIPGLILGQPVADVEHSYGRPFRFRSVYRGPWHTYDPQRTVFGDAHRLGWTTGIAAWFNPYCRFLNSVLDRCYWRYSDIYPGLPVRLYYERSTLANLWAVLPPHERLNPFAVYPIDHETHMRDYFDVMAQSESLLRDQRIRFVMLHLPVPHTPGIYDRGEHTLAAAGNYIDNLALSDVTLGTLMKVIGSTPDASQTSVIVSSDHSWRVDDWKKLSDWTAEEAHLSGGRFDTRPVLMVHLPGSKDGQVVSQPVSAMIVHPILEAMLHGQLRSPDDIAALVAGKWAGRQKDR
jgi:Sulfatase